MVLVTPIRLDLSLPNDYTTVVARQGDSNSRWLKATIYNRGTAVTVPITSNVRIECTRYDGETNAFNGNVLSDGTVMIPLTAWALYVDGEATCSVVITDTISTIGTASFKMVVTHADSDIPPCPIGSGLDGVGISSITLICTEDLTDTYQIMLTNGSAYTFDVKNGVSPYFNLIPDDDGYILTIAVGTDVQEYRIDPVFVDATMLVQQPGNSTTKVMSQKAVTNYVNSNKGWSTEAIDMLENLLHMVTYKNAMEGQGYADELLSILRSSKQLVSITATDLYPGRVRYIGRPVDTSEFKVEAVYSDGSTEDVDNYSVDPTYYTATGKLTFSYRELFDEVNVTVEEDALVDWQIIDYNPKEMLVGDVVAETLDMLKYKLIYASGEESIEDDMNNLSFSPTTINTAGEVSVAVTYSSYETTKTISITGTTVATYPVTYSGDNCTISVMNGQSPVESGSYVNDGTSLTLNAVADGGYRIVSVKVNGTAVTVPHTIVVNDSVNIVVDTELAPSSEVTYTGSVKGGWTSSPAIDISGDGTFTEDPTYIKLVADTENPGARVKYAILKRNGDVWNTLDVKYGTGTVTVDPNTDTATVEFAPDYSTVKISKVQATVIGTWKENGVQFNSASIYAVTVANYELEV